MVRVIPQRLQLQA